MRALLLLTLAAAIAGCASQPMLYPNEHLKNVGEDQARTEIKECYASAKQRMKKGAGADVAGQTVEGGVIGAAAGAAGGAVLGSAARGAAGGGVTGAAVGLIRGLLRIREPSPARKAFINRCLSQRGYEVVGWE